MFDLVVRRVAALAAVPALFALSAPAIAHGPISPPRPNPGTVPTATPRTPAPPAPGRSGPATAPAARPATPATSATAAPPARPRLSAAQIRARAVTTQVIQLTNNERREAGCPTLAVDGQLVTASARQSTYMARTRLFSHVWRDGSTFVKRTRDAGYEQPAGENIAWGYRSAPDVVEAWMGSPGHRRNILNCKARSMGASVAFAADGTPYYTQVFGWQ